MSAAALVKICGFRLRETAEAVARMKLAIDYAGFVFAPSKRRVSAEEARDMMDAFGADAPAFVGVFVNPTMEELADINAIAPLAAIQLHGGEPPHFCREVKSRFPHTEVWRSMGMRQDQAHDEASVFARLAHYDGAIDALLLDAWDPHVGGGTGQTFQWDLVGAYRKWTEMSGVKLYVAGGLHADNVNEMLSVCAADGADVSSGVETDGVKDIEKIRKFTERVKGR
jgi:phosphoribosylanthranilate isomerase